MKVARRKPACDIVKERNSKKLMMVSALVNRNTKQWNGEITVQRWGEKNKKYDDSKITNYQIKMNTY